MPRVKPVPARSLTVQGLHKVADAAGFAASNFQESVDLPDNSTSVVRYALILLPMFLALTALGFVAMSI